MSRFFRSSASSSSGSSDSDPDISDGEDTRVSVKSAESKRIVNGTADTDVRSSRVDVEDPALLVVANQAVSRPIGHVDNSQLLLHALLEERCMKEVTEELARRGIPPHRIDQAYVKSATRQRYQRLCATLAQHNLVASGPEHDTLFNTRQNFRDGLDLLSREQATGAVSRSSAFAHVSRKLLTTSNATSAIHSGSLADIAGLNLTASPSPLMFVPTRYAREFDQISTLGRGGFGVVYHVQNRIDGIQYAVKKVPINPSRAARIQAQGQTEIAELTREVRYLARLEHPNIVRYYAAWVEWSSPLGSVADSQSSGLNSGLDMDSFMSAKNRTGEADDSVSLHRVITESNSNGIGIVFEDSKSASSASSSHQPSIEAQSQSESAAAAAALSMISTGALSESTTNGALLKQSGPTLCLHLQMGLYPLTLADFLSPPPPPPSQSSQQPVQPLCHCFHIEPTLSILSAVVAGVDYLHSESILHRDLKPANIFMSAQTSDPRTKVSSAAPSAVDLFRCSDCRAKGTANPVNLHVRIGDFGLVTELARPEEMHATSNGRGSISAVGTEIYRPLAAVSNASPQLDVFALGIIMFELLWKFNTRMERHECILNLKHGIFPAGFSSAIGDCGGRVQACILEMLSGELELVTLRQKLLELQAMRS